MGAVSESEDLKTMQINVEQTNTAAYLRLWSAVRNPREFPVKCGLQILTVWLMV